MKMEETELKLYNTDEEHIRGLISSATEKKYGKDVCKNDVDYSRHLHKQGEKIK